MNLPNKLTIFRIFLIFLFFSIFITPHFIIRIVCFFIFLLSIFTDILDGFLARRYSQVTDFGKVIDPLADKILAIIAFVYFSSLSEINVPLWMVSLIIIREFLIEGLRSISALRKKVIQASPFGKLKNTIQVFSITLIFLILILSQFFELPSFLFTQFTYFLVLFVTVITVFSGIDYFTKNFTLIKQTLNE